MNNENPRRSITKFGDISEHETPGVGNTSQILESPFQAQPDITKQHSAPPTRFQVHSDKKRLSEQPVLTLDERSRTELFDRRRQTLASFRRKSKSIASSQLDVYEQETNILEMSRKRLPTADYLKSLAVIKQKLKQSTSGNRSTDNPDDNSLNRTTIQSVNSRPGSITTTTDLDETSNPIDSTNNTNNNPNNSNYVGQSSYIGKCGGKLGNGNIGTISDHSISHYANNTKCPEQLDNGNRVKNRFTKRSETAPVGSSMLEEGIVNVGQRLSLPTGTHGLALRRKSALYGEL